MANGGFYNEEKLKPVFVFIIVEWVTSIWYINLHQGSVLQEV